jgi:hypothetical protein
MIYAIGGSTDAGTSALVEGVVEEYTPLRAVMSLNVDAKGKSATFWGEIKTNKNKAPFSRDF